MTDCPITGCDLKWDLPESAFLTYRAADLPVVFSLTPLQVGCGEGDDHPEPFQRFAPSTVKLFKQLGPNPSPR
jgi:hypothetical protein